MIGGLVQEQQGRILCECPRNMGTLAFTSGQYTHPFIRQCAKPGQIENSVKLSCVSFLGMVSPNWYLAQGNVVPEVQSAVRQLLLADNGNHAGAFLVRHLFEAASIDLDIAQDRFFYATKQVQQSRFPGSVRTGNCQNVAPIQLERNALQQNVAVQGMVFQISGNQKGRTRHTDNSDSNRGTRDRVFVNRGRGRSVAY